MSLTPTIRTFTKGMVQDLDKSYVSKENYLSAYNFRLTTGDGESAGALENVDGNNLLFNTITSGLNSIETDHKYLVVKEGVTYNGVVYDLLEPFTGVAGFTDFTGAGEVIDLFEITPENMYICGGVNIRDTIVLFLTNNSDAAPDGGRGMIVKLTISTSTEKLGTVTTIYDDSLNNSGGYLNFSLINPIKAVVAYESSTIQKVYWTDGYNNVRYCNIMSNLTTDGEAYDGGNYYLPVDKLEFLPEFTPSRPVFSNLLPGNIPTGKVQYSYQLYFSNGSTTSFSPASDMIHLVKENAFATDNLKYKGEADVVNSGKGVELEITVSDIGYNRLRLVRIHYGNYGSVPSIDVVSEIPIDIEGGTYIIQDVGNTIANLTIDEFNISSTESFVCEDLEVKDRRLFAANIEKNTFDITDWDARAVRYRVGAGTPTAYPGTLTTQDDLIEFTVTASDYRASYIDDTTIRYVIRNWTATYAPGKTVTDITDVICNDTVKVATGQYANGSGTYDIDYQVDNDDFSISEINWLPGTGGGTLSFYLTKDSGDIFTDFVSLEDQTTPAGQSITSNVPTLYKIQFEYTYEEIAGGTVEAFVYDSSDLDTETVIEVPATDIIADWNTAGWEDYVDTHDGINKFNDSDNDGDADYEFMYQSNGIYLGAEGPNIKIDFADDVIDLDNFGDNTTVGVAPLGDDGYCNPSFESKLSWQRDEVYRLFITFFNERGQASTPKWICDLRMPSLHESDSANSSLDDVHFDTLAEGLATVTGYRLYPRVFIKNFPTGASYAQISRVKREENDRNIITQAMVIPTVSRGGDDYGPAELEDNNLANQEIIKLMSPEINITKNITTSGEDYLDYLGDYDTNDNLYRDTTDYRKRVHKLRQFTKVAAAANNITDIDDTMFITCTDTGTVPAVDFGGKTYTNYSATIETDKTGRGSSGMLVNYSNASWTAESNNYCIVNYKKNRFGGQYGGYTYEARSYNTAIPCSEIISSSDEGAWVNVEYGDTYITYFNAMSFVIDTEEGDSKMSTCEGFYVPLESSINCNLLSGINAPHRELYEYGGTESGAFLLHERAGTYAWDSETLVQESDIYSYNPVYSQEQLVQQVVAMPIDVSTETSFDCMVKVSGVKYNNETTDSWTKFAVNDYIEVDTSYGAINALKTVNNKLLFWQSNAFGVLSVNDRSIVQDTNSAAIVLGTGGILDRYDYISLNTGTSDKFTVLNAPSGVYWFYPKEKSLYRFSEGLENLSKTRMLQSWFNQYYPSHTIVRAVYDYKYNQVLYTFKETDEWLFGEGITIAFDESVDSFTSFYNFSTSLYVPFNEGYLSVGSYNSTTEYHDAALLYLHNSQLKERSCFYSYIPAGASDEAGADTPMFVDSKVKVIYNDNYSYPKVFDTGFYSSEVTLDGVEQQTTTFDTVECYNNYQNTSVVDLDYADNLRRREREWSYVIPRNVVSTTYTDNEDPSLTINQDSTRLFKERLRDKYMVSELTFNNTSDYRIVVPYVGVRYRISYR